MENKLVVLSFFDGASIGQLALNKLGISNYVYYASEIDKYAIAVTNYNFPNTIQIGDIRNVTYSNGILSNGIDQWHIGNVDLMLGGFSCQSLSLVNRTYSAVGLESNTLDAYLELKRKGHVFEGASYLFWELLRLKKEIQPKYFLYENVLPNSHIDLHLITKNVGVTPHLIDSRYFSAQKRRRYYWTNIAIDDYSDMNIKLSDVILDDDDPLLYKWLVSDAKLEFLKRKVVKGWVKQIAKNGNEKAECLLASDYKRSQEQIWRMRDGKLRMFSVEEREMLQTWPIHYTKFGYVKNNKLTTISNTQRIKMIGNGWTASVIVHILKNINIKPPIDNTVKDNLLL